jgi:L-fucono-1,5-lactonase
MTASASGPAVIDAHVHLWDLDVRPQPWTDDLPPLRRSFAAGDLRDVLGANGVDAAIVVQAGDTTDETTDLLAIAATEPLIAGVIGWVDLTSSDVDEQLASLHSAPGGDRLVGVRHQLQIEPDPLWLGRSDVRDGLAVVAKAGLIYDVVVSSDQLPLVAETVKTVAGLRFVLDHAGKPPVRSGDLGRWRHDIDALASCPRVAVKLSGLVTEADWATWTQDQLDPVVEHVLAAFGPDRTMAGSDWPVCLLAADYGSAMTTLTPALDRLRPAGRDSVRGGTASRWYGLGGVDDAAGPNGTAP